MDLEPSLECKDTFFTSVWTQTISFSGSQIIACVWNATFSYENVKVIVKRKGLIIITSIDVCIHIDRHGTKACVQEWTHRISITQIRIIYELMSSEGVCEWEDHFVFVDLTQKVIWYTCEEPPPLLVLKVLVCAAPPSPSHKKQKLYEYTIDIRARRPQCKDDVNVSSQRCSELAWFQTSLAQKVCGGGRYMSPSV